MEELLSLIIKSSGVAGIIMALPIIALVFVWRLNLRLQKHIYTIQESRVQDAKSVGDKLISIVAEQSALNKETNMALERVGDMLSFVSNQHSNR